MAFARCGRTDPFTKRVREVYSANVLRVPRAGVQPLLALAVADRRVDRRGELAELLGGDAAFPEPVTQPVADLSGMRSTSLDMSVGVSLTTGFLAALGLPVPGGDLSGTLFTGAKTLEFEVRDVSERTVDLGAVGKAMAGRSLDDNAATRIFLTDPSVRLLVVSRVLVSRHFAVHTTGRAGQSAEVSVDAIKDVIGQAQAAVTWKREGAQTVSFQGDQAVTFAFAAVPCAVQTDRSLIFGVEVDDLTFGEAPAQPQVKPVVDDDGLLEFDDELDRPTADV
jgi:hypothetical protein